MNNTPKQFRLNTYKSGVKINIYFSKEDYFLGSAAPSFKLSLVRMRLEVGRNKKESLGEETVEKERVKERFEGA